MHRGTFNFRLVLNRVWHDIWDSCNSSHCLLTVRGWLRVVKIRAKCVRYLWLSCPVWPSRWVLCISMQWLRSKVCHDECVSGEICSLQHMWVTRSVMWAVASGKSLKFGVQGVSEIDFRELTAHEITGFDFMCTTELTKNLWNYDFDFLLQFFLIYFDFDFLLQFF